MSQKLHKRDEFGFEERESLDMELQYTAASSTAWSCFVVQATLRFMLQGTSGRESSQSRLSTGLGATLSSQRSHASAMDGGSMVKAPLTQHLLLALRDD